MNNIIVCDFVFVPNGRPFPHDWVRRHPDDIVLPARFKGTPAFMRRMFGPRYGQKPAPQTIEVERPADGPPLPSPEAATMPRNHLPGMKHIAWDMGEIDSLARPFLDVADLGLGLLTERFGPGIRVAANGALPIATTEPPTARYIAKRPEDWDGHTAVGSGYCVPLVQEATRAPRSTEWKRGAQVWGATGIPRGTAIATFDADGHYTSNGVERPMRRFIFIRMTQGFMSSISFLLTKGVETVNEYNRTSELFPRNLLKKIWSIRRKNTILLSSVILFSLSFSGLSGNCSPTPSR